MPEPMIFEPLLLPDPASDPPPDPASDPLPELLEGVPPELLLPDPEPELPLLLPEPDWPPDEPLLNEPLPEPLVEPFGVPLGPPVEPPLLPLPPLGVLPPAAFAFVLVPLLLPVGWLFRELGVVGEPEHSQAPPASAATSQGVHPIFLMVTPSNQVRTDRAVTGPFTTLAKATRDLHSATHEPNRVTIPVSLEQGLPDRPTLRPPTRFARTMQQCVARSIRRVHLPRAGRRA
jgi:hypothetical protein